MKLGLSAHYRLRMAGRNPCVHTAAPQSWTTFPCRLFLAGHAECRVPSGRQLSSLPPLASPCCRLKSGGQFSEFTVGKKTFSQPEWQPKQWKDVECVLPHLQPVGENDLHWQRLQVRNSEQLSRWDDTFLKARLVCAILPQRRQ